jgi:hypothetical protein
MLISFWEAFNSKLCDFVFAGEMMPLTGAEMKKYIAELEKSKNLDGYVSSNPAGVSLRKLKRKEAAKGDAVVIEVEGVGTKCV